MANKTYIIINKRSNKALTLTADNTVVQADINYRDEQLWYTTKCLTNVKISNKSNGKNLDPMYGSSESGTALHTWEDSDVASQLWQLVTTTRGYKKIVNTNSNKVLDIVMLSEENGALAQIWDDLGGDNQEWKVSEYPARVRKTPVKKTVAKK